MNDENGFDLLILVSQEIRFYNFVENTKAGDKNVKIKISSLKDRFVTSPGTNIV
jgi:hypothetical protein